MRSRVLIAVLVLAFALVGTIYYVFFRTPLQEFHEVDLAALSEIQYCDIKKNPDRYNGKVVKIRAPLGNFMHGAFFQDSLCNEKYYEELLDDNRTAVGFFAPKREELFSTYNAMMRKKEVGGTIPIVAVGRFEWKYPEGISDSIGERTSFHFEVYSIGPAPD